MIKPLAALVLCLAAPAYAAAPVPTLLTPADATISYTAFALDLLPVTGTFKQFAGTVTVPPGTQDCRVQMQVQIASLRMDDTDRQRQALAPDMLDATHFPTMGFTGTCQGQSLTGRLTLHGVTRPVSLTIRREAGHVICTGTLQRRDFGIRGLTGLVAPRIHIRLNVTLPPDLGAAAR
jgi:polyisoprenoid-binding protein YceI